MNRDLDLLDELEKVGIADGLCGLDLIHLAVEGGPAHAMRLADRITNAAVRSETPPALERLADGPIVGTLALRAVGEAMDLVGGKDPVPGWLVELGDKIPPLRSVWPKARTP